MKNNSIAIISMACIAPGAHSPEELWQNILAGRRFFRKAPDERLPRKWYYDPDPDAPGKTYCDQMAVITNWEFDPFQFKIAPITQNASDLSQWLALDTSKQLFDRVKINLESLDKSRIGIILGNSLTGEFSRSHNMALRVPFIRRTLEQYLILNKFSQSQAEQFVESFIEYYYAPLPEPNEDTLSGNMSNVIAGRIAYNFDFGAGAYTVDGACSSSLLSVVHACNALTNGEMDMAVAGGVDVSLDPFEIVGFAKTKALTKDDIKPYDKNADGMLPGEGCGLLLLEREEDARKNGHQIFALLKGWGYSSDGRTGGITAPKVEGQMRALNNAYKVAGYPISSVQLFEGHGTGTPVGDAVELECIKRMLDESGSKNLSRIGSIKSNIGHCKAAAGIMGIIKATMALNYKILPPTTNCTYPSPVFGQPLTNFEPIVKGEAWNANGQPRRASVSGMGFGGSNGHVTLEEANPETEPTKENLDLLHSGQKTEVILLDASTAEQLHEKINALIPVADRICRAEFTDLSAALAKKINHGKFRFALVAESPWQLHDTLQKVSRQLEDNRELTEINNPSEGIYIGEAKPKVKIAGLFPGQGSHFINMGEQLKQRYPFIRGFYTGSDENIRDIFPDLLSNRIFTNIYRLSDEALKEFENTLKNTGTAQPAIVLSSMAMMKILDHFGIQPDICLGHSLGEISAMSATGFFDEPTAVKIAALRGKAKTDLDIPDPGAMAAIVASAEEVDEMLKSFTGQIISVANYNAQNQTVVSGSTEAVNTFVKTCKEKQVACRLLPVSHAFHSEIVAPASVAFEKSLIELGLGRKIKKEKTLSRFISTATGDYLTGDTDLIKLLSEHIRKPVHFIEAVKTAAEQHPDIWIEIGPGGVLSGLVKSITGADTLCLTSNVKHEELFTSLNHLLAQCFAFGVDIKTEKLFEQRFYRELDPDNYHPIFITNPCERKVDVEALNLKPSNLFASGLLPETEDQPALDNYLEHRKDFIKDIVALDYKHFSGEAGTMIRPENFAPREKVSERKDTKSETAEDPVTFAINWISKRTGIPVNRINPEMRLRDDLNLDSIRAGELVIVLAKQLKADKAVADPSIFANAKIIDLVEHVKLKSANKTEQENTVKEQVNVIDDTITSVPWVNSFLMEQLEYPIANETNFPLQKNETLTIICNDTNFPCNGLIASMQEKGVSVETISWENCENKSAGAGSLLMILPKSEQPFYSQSEDDFINRSQALLKNVFTVIKNRLDKSGSFPDGFRCMMVDFYSHDEFDSNESSAFHSFLKSLKLEHKEARFKMLSIPELADDTDNIILTELEHFSERIRIEYTAGKRFTWVAAPITEEGKEILKLGTEDVVIVSGGAKGITFEHALALGREFNVKLALLGTSPHPQDNDDNSELSLNLKRLEKENITYLYLQCDVTDAESVQKAFGEAESKLGNITGIFHGAGISKFNLFRDKSFEEFFECFRVKAFGLFNLIKACNPEKLKMLHVISSVLGHSGMRSQCDYTFANAWLDEAVRSFSVKFPAIHCLTLGYTVWGEAGLGKKLGALDYLKTVGVNALKIKEGISSYLNILKKVNRQGAYVITGRLSNDLEANLFAPLSKINGRFLERILRYVPQTEIATEFTLSHGTDLYLQEHIYNGTPIMPAVMIIEAMVQAVLQCRGTFELPVLKNIRFITPIIVPKGEQVKIRVIVAAQYQPIKTPHFTIQVKASTNEFSQNYIEADCFFEKDVQLPEGLPFCPVLGEPLPFNPDELSPYPLFQGKLFRRIEKIYRQDFEKDCITTIKVPDGEQYFADGLDSEIYFGSPAVRDSAYQSGLLALPLGALPDVIQEIRMFKKMEPGNRLIFKLHELVKKNTLEYDVSFVVFNLNQELVAFEKISLKKPESGSLQAPVKKIKPISIDRIESDLKSLLPDVKHAIALVPMKSLNDFIENEELTKEEVAKIKQSCSEARLTSTLANLIAARRAAIKFISQYGKNPLKPQDVHIAHQKDGKPLLAISETYADIAIFANMDISIADGGGYSIAFIGPGKVGVDIEPVEYRDAETWLGLLGRDGYNLAMELTDKNFENFDVSATRVWSVIEAIKKANDLQKLLPENFTSLGGSWLLFNVNSFEIISGITIDGMDLSNKILLSLTIKTI